MTEIRRVGASWRGRPVLEGAGVHLKRVFGYSEVVRMDPFLLLDDFRSQDPTHYLAGFPWHPHRGIETITYMLAGSVEHRDSLGNQGVIHPGDLQWMTAGSGIIHQEMPRGDDSGCMEGFQLWANLPRKNKLDPPRYREVKAEEVPVLPLHGGGHIRVLCGEVQGVRGPVTQVVTDPLYLDIQFPAGAQTVLPVDRGHTVLAYIIAGEIRFHKPVDHRGGIPGSGYYGPRQDATYGDGDFLYLEEGDGVFLDVQSAPARVLLFSGKPLGEPVAWQGPIVMNTQAELDAAFAELRNGTFIKK